MKDGVILINTSRGGLINEDDLVNALNSGKIYAAGLDVISEEPPRHDLGILHCENATITDHIAYLPKTSRLRSVSVAISNFKAYLDGCPTSVINKQYNVLILQCIIDTIYHQWYTNTKLV